jgi:hypothetical protein
MRRFVKFIAWIVGGLLTVLVAYTLWFFAFPYMMAPDSLDKKEAQQLLTSELTAYRAKTYRQLADGVGASSTRGLTGASGAIYTIEVSSYWDSEPHQDVRVIAAIGDHGKSAYVPMTDSFIMSPSGKFVGE